MVHNARGGTATPPRGGGKPPVADGAKKNLHGPANAAGKDSHGPDKGGKGGQGRPPPPPRGARPLIADDLPEEPVAAVASPFFSLPALHLPSARTLRRVLVIGLVAALTVGSIYGLVEMVRHNMELARQARLQAAIAGAIDTHARKHHGEGRTYEEISYTDYLRRCVGSAVTAPGYATAHDLAGTTGLALLADAEADCLRTRAMEMLSMPRPGDVPDADELKAKEDRVRAFLVFAREHGYRFPPDLMTYEHPAETAPRRPGDDLP